MNRNKKPWFGWVAAEAAQRCEFRSTEEAKQAVEILKRRARLGKKEPKPH